MFLEEYDFVSLVLLLSTGLWLKSTEKSLNNPLFVHFPGLYNISVAPYIKQEMFVKHLSPLPWKHLWRKRKLKISSRHITLSKKMLDRTQICNFQRTKYSATFRLALFHRNYVEKNHAAAALNISNNSLLKLSLYLSYTYSETRFTDIGIWNVLKICQYFFLHVTSLYGPPV